MDALKHHKRYLAMLTALSMLVTFIVPLILIEPADSMSGILICGKYEHTHNAECYVDDTLVCELDEHIHTEDCYLKYSSALRGNVNDGSGQNVDVYNAFGADANYDAKTDTYYSPESVPLYTLLFGETANPADHWVDSGASLEDNLLRVGQEYFLGYASDFCAFIEGDFIAYDADAEGRMFVGGDLIFRGQPGGEEWNYQVGAGDYGHSIPIWETDEYDGITGFASGIIGGKVYRLGTMTTFSTLTRDYGKVHPLPGNRELDRHFSGYDIFLYPEEGAYKKFIVGNLDDSLHLDEDYLERNPDGLKDVPYETSCNHLYFKKEGQADDKYCGLCNNKTDEAMEAEHKYLSNVNEKAQFYNYSGVNTILEKTFDTLRARSMSLGSIDAIEATIAGDTLVLNATNIGDAKTVYFNVRDWDKIADTTIRNIQIIVPPKRVTFTEDGDKEKEFALDGGDTIKNLDLNIIISCDDPTIEIPRSISTYIKAGENGETPDDGKGYRISNAGTPNVAQSNATNNHHVSSNILYNFYNATLVDFSGEQGGIGAGEGANFNGTILAPNAHVESEKLCPGHLSGALIAKSFEGGLEFGYRPYRGGVDIFGMVSGYGIPVNKYVEGKLEDGEPVYLPGALFAIKEEGKFVSLFESGKGTNFAALPSRVDFSGNGPYRADEIIQSSVDREYSGQTETGEKLTAPVEFTLYSDTNFNDDNKIIKIENDAANVNNLVKFYLQSEQDLNFVENEYFKAVKNDGYYEIYLIKPIPSDGVNITVQNVADSTSSKTVEINSSQNMKLNIDPKKDSYKVGDKITLAPSDTPEGDTIYYKYFVNGNPIEDSYRTDAYYNYEIKNTGNMTYSVKAYVLVNNEYYEIAQAEATKIEAYDENNFGIMITNSEDVDVSSVTSGESYKIKVISKDNTALPQGATVKYYVDEQLIAQEEGKTELVVDTVIKNENGEIVGYIAGKDFNVKVEIVQGNNTIVRNDTITVNFKDGISFVDYANEYVVGSHTYNFSLKNSNYKDAAITYYFRDQQIEGTSITPTIVGNDIPVRAKISVHGLELDIYGPNVNGKYPDNLGDLDIQDGPFEAGNNIGLELKNALNGASIVFKAYDSYGNQQWASDPQTVVNGTCSAQFPTNRADTYTIRAFMRYAENPEVEVDNGSIYVAPKTLSGSLSVTPSRVYTGSPVEFKLTNAPEYAQITLRLTDQNGQTITFNGNTDGNGECVINNPVNQAGTYKVEAEIQKDGNKGYAYGSLEVVENTAAFTGNYTYEITKHSDDNFTVKFKVYSDAEGAATEITITNANGRQFCQSGNINGGSWETQIPIVGSTGTHSIQVTISKNGTTTNAQGEPTLVLGSSAEGITGSISISRNEGSQDDDFINGEPVNIKFVTNESGKNKQVVLKLYYYEHHLGDKTIDDSNNDGVYETQFTPENKGTHRIEAYISNTLITVFYVDINALFTLHGPYVVNDWGYIDLSRIDEDEGIGEVISFTIGGQNVSTSDYYIDKENNKILWFKPIQTCENVELYLKVKLTKGAITHCTKRLTVVSAQPASVVSAYSFRRNLSILGDEGIAPIAEASEDNLISITAPTNEPIGKVNLFFPNDVDAKNSTFKLKVTFTDVNDKTCVKYYDKGSEEVKTSEVEGNPDYLELITSGLTATDGNQLGDIKNITVEAVNGSITIQSYVPTFLKEDQLLTKTTSVGFNLKPSEQKEIVIDDKLKSLESITFNFNADGTLNYAFVTEGATDEAVFNSCTIENNTVTIPNETGKNVVKIKIYTPEASNVTQYSINSYVGVGGLDNAEQEALLTENLDIINYYTLVEQQAPTGYFKEETIYNIEVKETVKLNKLQVIGEGEDEEVYPTVVYTTITVKKKDGTIALQYTVEVHPETNGIYNADSRILIIHNTDGTTTTFKVRKGANDEVEVLSADNNPIAKSSSTFKFSYDNKEYYLDPGALMIVPVPAPIEYNNRTGLLFRKVDNSGVPVQDALIELYKEVEDGVFVNVEGVRNADDTGWITEPDPIGSYWNWTQGSTTECLLPIEALVENVTYKFHEANVSDKYELAKDIFFKKISDTQIEYWEEGGDSVTIDISTNNVIRMSDYKIPGIKLKIGKVGENNQALEGAVFDLYAEGDFKIKENINAGDGKGVEIDFSDTTKLEEGAERYVERGYLKPGSYYLIETTIPEHTDNDKWYEDPGKIGFRVKDDFTVECYDYSATASQLKTGNGSDNPWGYWLIFNDKSMKEPDSGGKIENVTNIYVVLTPYQGNTININECWTNNNSTAITTSSSPVKFEQSGNNYTLNWSMDSPKDFTQFKISGSDMVVSYVKITTADGTEHIFKEPDYVLEDSGNTPENEDEKIPALTVDGNTITVGNNVGENSRDIKVNKKWLGDNGFEEFRKPVTITLYQSKTEITDRSHLTDAMKYKKNGEVYTITLNEASNWTGAFEDVEVKYLDESDGKYKDYYYYIVEEPIENYATTYETKPDGTLIVNNILETVEIPVKKHWVNDTGQEVAYPENITVQLQMLVDNDGSGPAIPQWEDVPDKLLTLTPAGEWKGTFSGLAKGHSYRVKEASVKIGWQVDDSLTDIVTVDENGNISEQKGSVDNTLEITNKPQAENLSNLEIQKLWDSYENLPDSIKVRLFRKTLYATYPIGQPATSVTNEDGSVTVGVQDDYARLLQYSLYFYDANMCGDTAAENSAIAWRGDCHTDDEIKGGFHDAGDHVMFGLPQGYSASMLGWSFYEFKDAYDELNQTEHIKKITEHFCDFFVQAAHFVDGNEENAISEILVQKGAGNPDHQYWGPPENQPSRNDSVILTDDGRGATGWNNGQWTLDNEMFWTSSGGDIAAEYAAALALAYLNFNDGSDKYSNYLAMAEKFYQFAQGKGVLDDWGINKDELATIQQYPGFYKSDGADDDRAWAAGWLYLATGRNNNDYKTACFNLDNDVGSWAFSWNDVKLAAACVSAHVNSNDKADPWKKVREYVSGKAGDGFYRPEANNCWGTARYNAALQMAALALTKNDSQSDYKNWAKAQMAMILGNNNWNGGKSVCLVTGFAENSAKYAHHRAASGWQSLEEYKNPAHTTYAADSQTLIGAMVGGPYFGAHTDAQMTNYGHKNLLESHNYLDDLHDYCCNEVALDYQAGLVGAAAGLYHFFKTGSTFEIPGNSIETQYVTASAASVPTLLMGPQVVSMQKTAVSVLAAGDVPNYIISSDEVFSESSNKDGKNYNFNLNNVTSIEIEYSFAGANGGAGFNMAYNDKWDSSLLQPNQNATFNSQTNRYKFTHNFTTPFDNIYKITLQKPWNATSSTIHSLIVYTQSTGPSISSPKSTIAVGDSMTLTYSEAGVTPNWSVDNTNLAEIDSNGQLTAKAAGTVVVTANEATKNIIIEELAIGGSETMKKDSTQELTINSINGIGGVTWDSSDSDVVEVDGGVVTAKAAGTATITATNNGYTDTFDITVVDIRSVTINVNQALNIHNGPKEHTIKFANNDEPIFNGNEKIMNIIVNLSASGNISTTQGLYRLKVKPGTGNNQEKDKHEQTNQTFNITITDGKGSHKINTSEINDIDLTKDGQFEFGSWYGNPADITIDSIVIEYIIDRRITSDKDTVMVKLPVNFTAVGFADNTTWTVTDESGTQINVDNATGTAFTFTPTAVGTYTITATDEGGSLQKIITVTPYELKFEDNTTEKAFTLRKNNSLDIDFNVESDQVSITEVDTEYLIINGTTVSVKDDTPVGTIIHFRAEYIGDNNAATNGNGSVVTGTIEVLEELQITAEDLIYNGETIELSANGDVEWSIESGEEYASLNGNKLTGIKKGTVVVKATDQTDGSTATISIAVKIGAVGPGFDISKGYEAVLVDENEVIEILAREGWTKKLELPVKDPNGNYYMYFFAECDQTGKLISGGSGDQIAGKNGAFFVPLEYQNGTVLTQGISTGLSVKNSLAVEAQGTLPSTGGSGVTTYYYLGGVIMLLSIAGFTGLKRREKKRRKEE